MRKHDKHIYIKTNAVIVTVIALIFCLLSIGMFMLMYIGIIAALQYEKRLVSSVIVVDRATRWARFKILEFESVCVCLPR